MIHTSPFIITYYWLLLREVFHVWFVVVGCFDAYNINSATFPYIIEGLSALCYYDIGQDRYDRWSYITCRFFLVVLVPQARTVLRQEIEQLRMGNKMTCWIHRSRPFRWFISRRFSCCGGGVNREFTFSHILPIDCKWLGWVLWRRNYELRLGGDGRGDTGYRLKMKTRRVKTKVAVQFLCCWGRFAGLLKTYLFYAFNILQPMKKIKGDP